VRARSNDPTTWSTRDQAAQCRDDLSLPCGEGCIGIVLTEIGDGMAVVGIDLDTCIDDEGLIAD
jgi:hypothetical protein